MKPSVTQLIALLDKPNIVNWANKIGLEGVKLEDYRKKSTFDGLSIHKQIELYVKNKIPFASIETQTSFEQYFINKKILSIEGNVETDYFIGRYDIKMEYNGKIYLCDFKSNQKFVYLENKLQLSAYKMGSYCDGVGIISVPDFKFLPVIIKDFEPYFEIIKALSKIYSLKKQIENGY